MGSRKQRFVTRNDTGGAIRRPVNDPQCLVGPPDDGSGRQALWGCRFLRDTSRGNRASSRSPLTTVSETRRSVLPEPPESRPRC